MGPVITGVDLASLGGLALAVTLVVGGIKKLWPVWCAGKEPTLALVLSYALGAATKLTVPGAYAGVDWATLMVMLFFVALASQSIHDRVVNKVIKKEKA